MKIKNVILIIMMLGLLAVGIMKEPIQDSYDMLAGASTETYRTQIDLITGASDVYGSGDSYGE